MGATIFYNNMMTWLSLASIGLTGPQAIQLLGTFIAMYVATSVDMYGNSIIGFTASEFVSTILSYVVPNPGGAVPGAIIYDVGLKLAFTAKQLSPLLLPPTLQALSYQGVSNMVTAPPTSLSDWIKVFTFPIEVFSNGPQQLMSLTLRQTMASLYVSTVTKAISTTTTLLTAQQIIPPFLITTVPGVLIPV